MKKPTLMQYIIYTAVMLLGIGVDQLTKWLSVFFLKPISTFPIINDVLHLTYVENEGAAFGMLANHRWVFIIISSVTIAVLIYLVYSGRLLSNKLYTVSVLMIISGGIGNMIDRIALGYVIDFIDFRLINFAVFNGADSFVCVGAGILMLGLILDIIKESKRENQNAEDKEN